MKKLRKILGIITAVVLVLTMLPTDVFAAGSYSAYSTKTTLTVGSTASIKISTKKAAGKFTVTSSNPNVVSVTRASTWVDGSTMDNNIGIKAVAAGTATITITPTNVSDDEYKLLTNTKSIKITVNKKATTNNNTNKEDNKTDDKVTTVTKSSNANLKSLSTSVASLSFKADQTKYTVNVDKTVTSLGLKAVASDSKATVKVSGDKDFKVGENTVKVTVTAENGTTKTYEVTVVKSKYGSGPLKLLKIKGYELLPEFDPSELNYNLTVVGVTNVEVEYELTSKDSKAVVEGAKELKEGKNLVKVVVTEKDGKVTTYTVNVNVIMLDTIEDNNILWLIIIIILVLLIAGETVYIVVAKKKENEEKQAQAKSKAKTTKKTTSKK